MSIAALSSTTLSAAIDSRQTRFVVASTTSINGTGSLTSPQSILAIDGEAMLVQNVPLAGTVEVIRGVNGTAAKPHANAAVAYFGAKTLFGSVEDGCVGLLGTGGTPDGILPTYRLPLGSRKFLNGKEYVFCDFNVTVHSGVCVAISNDGLFKADPAAASFNGAVGVVAEQTSTSDQWGWVQVYGTASVMDASATSGITSAYVPIVAGSVSTPATGMTALVNTTSTPQKYIYNMFITGDATTAVTSAASHTGVGLPVFLNYPYTFAVATDPGFS